MKHYVSAAAALLALAGCVACTELSPQDRKLLDDTHAMAEQARDQATQAADAAKQAQASAAQSAASAQAAQKKADRIFREGQNK